MILETITVELGGETLRWILAIGIILLTFYYFLKVLYR